MLMTDIVDANGLQRAIRPTGFFNIKKMAADFCSVQCIMDNTGSLTGINNGIESYTLYETVVNRLSNKFFFAK